MNPDLNKFIEELGKEIKQSDDEYLKVDAMKRIEDIARDYNGEDKIVSSIELYEKIKLQPEEKKIFTGFGDLDAILGGFRRKQLVVVSAATKSGKTSFCMEITTRVKEENPMWLPFEEPAEELLRKFYERNAEPPIFYTPEKMTGNTLLWVEKKIVEAKAKYNSKIVFIDHLHFIVPMTSERQDLAIGQAMRELKRMAKQWDVVIVLIAHIKKTKVEIQPELEDLRDSSFIAQEADTVIMLWRESKREKGQIVITNNVNISVQANRRTGKTGNIKMIFDNGRFIEQDWKHEKNEKQNDEEW